MADDFEVTGRTIRRDLELFRSVGFPLEETVEDRGRKTWRIKGDGNLPRLAFSFDEAIAIYLGQQLLEPLAGTPFGEAARDAFQKIRAVLGASALEYLERFSTAFHLTRSGLRDYASKFDLIADLQFAVDEAKEAQILYRSETDAEPRLRNVHPYGQIDHRGTLYLVAYDPKGDKIKHYKIDRIEKVDVGQAAPRPPEGFDLKAYMASAFAAYRVDGEPTEVRVRFGPLASRYIQESKWHASQRVTPLPGGAIEASFVVSGTEEIKSWIMGFGAKAVVLQPESLRQEIRLELDELSSAYAAPPVSPSPPSESTKPLQAVTGRRTRKATT